MYGLIKLQYHFHFIYPSFREGGGGGGGWWPMRDLGTDHVISGPMRGLDKKCMTNGQKDTSTDGRIDIATTRLTRPRGPSYIEHSRLIWEP